MKKMCGLLLGLALLLSVGCQPPAEPPVNDSNTTSLEMDATDSALV